MSNPNVPQVLELSKDQLQALAPVLFAGHNVQLVQRGGRTRMTVTFKFVRGKKVALHATS